MEEEDIQAIKEVHSEEKTENDVPTLVTLDVGEVLVIRRALHVNEIPLNLPKGSRFSTPSV